MRQHQRARAGFERSFARAGRDGHGNRGDRDGRGKDDQFLHEYLPFTMDTSLWIRKRFPSQDRLLSQIENSLVTQVSLVASVRLKITAPIHADHFQRESFAVHRYQYVMISAHARLVRRLGDAVKSNLLAFVLLDVIACIGIAGINVKRRAASTRDDLIEPMLPGLVYVMLHPMLEEMFVAREVDSDLMSMKERHV